jgi:hypothetical protein
MSKSKKYFLTFCAYALGILMMELAEVFFLHRLTPVKLLSPVLITLPFYSLLLYRIQRGKAIGD